MTTTPKRALPTDSAIRKTYPMCSGMLDYFPDALAAVSNLSYLGNEKHNPGEPLHHARGKSTDHADCIVRHLSNRGGFDGDTRESTALAWRALALLQEELETEMGLSLPRGARAPVASSNPKGFNIGDRVRIRDSFGEGTIVSIYDEDDEHMFYVETPKSTLRWHPASLTRI